MICFVNLYYSCSYLLHVVRAVLASWGVFDSSVTGSLTSSSSSFFLPRPLWPFPSWMEVTKAVITCQGFIKVWARGNAPYVGKIFPSFLVWPSWRMFFSYYEVDFKTYCPPKELNCPLAWTLKNPFFMNKQHCNPQRCSLLGTDNVRGQIS